MCARLHLPPYVLASDDTNDSDFDPKSVVEDGGKKRSRKHEKGVVAGSVVDDSAGSVYVPAMKTSRGVSSATLEPASSVDAELLLSLGGRIFSSLSPFRILRVLCFIAFFRLWFSFSAAEHLQRPGGIWRRSEW